MENEKKLTFKEAILVAIKNSIKELDNISNQNCPYKDWIIGYGSVIELHRNKTYQEIKKIFKNLDVRIEYGKMVRKAIGYYCELNEYYCMESISGTSYCFYMGINKEV